MQGSDDGKNTRDDVELAWAAAYGEKPVRDLGREKGVTEAEKGMYDQLAATRGERALAEYLDEKAKNPVEQMCARMDRIAEEMRAKGLESDAGIVEKVKGRIHRYAEQFKASKVATEESWGRRAYARDLLMLTNGYRMRDVIPVTHKIDADGGFLYFPSGFSGSWFADAKQLTRDEENDQIGQAAKDMNAEVINFSFSKEGEAVFLRNLGVLSETEEAIDIVDAYRRVVDADPERYEHGDTHLNSQDYIARFPINIDGVKVCIKKTVTRSGDGRREECISFEFDIGFLEAVLASK